MTAADAIDTIRLAKNVTRGASLAMFSIAVVIAFIFVLTTSPEEKIIDLISSAIYVAILMLAAYVSLLFLYYYAKNQKEETAKEPEEHKDGNDV